MQLYLLSFIFSCYVYHLPLSSELSFLRLQAEYLNQETIRNYGLVETMSSFFLELLVSIRARGESMMLFLPFLSRRLLSVRMGSWFHSFLMDLKWVEPLYHDILFPSFFVAFSSPVAPPHIFHFGLWLRLLLSLSGALS